MSKRNMGQGSAFKDFSRIRRRGVRPSLYAAQLAMDEHDRRQLRCDTCTNRFEPEQVIYVGKDNTHHCANCGRWRGLDPVQLHPNMFIDRGRRRSIQDRFGK